MRIVITDTGEICNKDNVSFSVKLVKDMLGVEPEVFDYIRLSMIKSHL